MQRVQRSCRKIKWYPILSIFQQDSRSREGRARAWARHWSNNRWLLEKRFILQIFIGILWTVPLRCILCIFKTKGVRNNEYCIACWNIFNECYSKGTSCLEKICSSILISRWRGQKWRLKDINIFISIYTFNFLFFYYS